MNKNFVYKNFEIETWKNPASKEWSFSATIYRFKGFREEEYFSINNWTLETHIKPAIKIIKNLIDEAINRGINFKSNGMMNWKELPSIKDLPVHNGSMI